MITVTLPGLDAISIEFVHEIEKALDAALVPLGWSRDRSSKTQDATILEYRQFGQCLSSSTESPQPIKSGAQA